MSQSPINKSRKPQVDLLIMELLKVPVGSVISYPDMSSVIGMNVQSNQGRSISNHARRHLERHHNVLFECHKNVGLKRLSDKEIVEGSSVACERIRKRARREGEKLDGVDYASLSPEERRLWGINRSILKVSEIANSKKARTRIEGAIEAHGAGGVHGPLPVGTVLNCLKSGDS